MHAEALRDTKFFGRMSPYIVIEHRKLRYKTQEDEDGHTEPVWNHEIDIPIYSMDEDIKIECFELGIIYDELICSTAIKISEIRENHNSEIEVPLYYKNKFAGLLKLFCFINKLKSKLFFNNNL